MKKLLLIFMLMTMVMLPGCSGNDESATDAVNNTLTESYEREPYRLELSYPEGVVDFGSTAEFLLWIEYPEDESYILLPPDVDSMEKYSNTIITGVDESGPVFDGNNRAVSKITFHVEAWLPGDLVFPPLTVSFGDELRTDEIVIPVQSAFEDTEEPRELSPLYIPDHDNSSRSTALIAIIAAVVLLLTAAIAASMLVLRHKKRKSLEVVPQKTREELIEEFRKNFIEMEGSVDLRKAFAEFESFAGDNNLGSYRNIIDEARFSKNSINDDEGRRILTELFMKLTSEGVDEL